MIWLYDIDNKGFLFAPITNHFGLPFFSSLFFIFYALKEFALQSSKNRAGLDKWKQFIKFQIVISIEGK